MANDIDRRGIQPLVVFSHQPSYVRYILGMRGFDPAELRFPVLADSVATVGATYGVAFQEHEEEWSSRPATLLIDSAGVIRFISERLETDIVRLMDDLDLERTLIKSLEQHGEPLRSASSLALRAMGRRTQRAIPPLIRSLGHENGGIRVGAAAALYWLAPLVQTHVPALIQSLDDSDARVRRYAAATLGRIGTEAGTAAQALVLLLKDDDPRVQSASLFALQRIGPAGGASVIHAMASKDERLRSAAVAAVPRFKIEASISVTALIKALQDEVPRIRTQAANALYELPVDRGRKVSAVPGLIAALKDPVASVRAAAADALNGLEHHAKDSVPSLIEALQDPERDVRARAARALAGIGPEARAAIPALITAVKKERQNARAMAAKALWRIGPHGDMKDAVEALIEALKEEDTEVRRQVIYALGSIGPQAQSALPSLMEISNRPGDKLRSEAADAIKEIAP